MCFNAAISLNTFMFSAFALALLIYNNKYTQYKIPELDNKWFYLLFFSVIAMQLIEYFLWKNINNAKLNNLFSILGSILIFIQPVFSIQLITDATQKTIFQNIYLLIFTPIYLYTYYTQKIHTTLSANHHLCWNWVPFQEKYYLGAFWCFCLLFPLLINSNHIFLGLLSLLLLIIIFYNYWLDKSFNSLWCLSVNMYSVFVIIQLLFVLPFVGKYNFC